MSRRSRLPPRARRPRRDRGRTRRTRGRRHASRRTRFAPMRPSPTMPSCIKSSSWCGDASAASAAPTMPARLPSSATRTSQPGFDASRNLSACLAMPPPITISSGHSTEWSCVRYVSRRVAQCFHESVLRRRASRRRPSASASLPSTSMCPSSEFGTSAPSSSSAVPMPVPTVTMSTTPRRPRAAPKRASARPAASASLSTAHGRPIARPITRGRVRADPRRVDVGGGAHRRRRRRRRAACTRSARVRRAGRRRRRRCRHRVGGRRAAGVTMRTRPVAVPGGEVDERRLDAGAADVDPDRASGLRHRREATPSRRMLSAVGGS